MIGVNIDREKKAIDVVLRYPMTTRSQIPEVPTPNSADKAHAALRAILAAIPGAGGAIVELLSLVVAPPLEKRRTKWMETVGHALAALQDQRRINLNSLRDNPLFIDAVLEASRIALRTSQEAKLQALRNAVLNSALRVEADETFHQIFLSLLDTLTLTHIDFLLKFDRGELFTASRDGFAWQFAALDDQPLLYKTIWKDLIDRGLLEGDLPLPNEQQNVISCRLTDLGKRFLDFIRNPVDG